MKKIIWVLTLVLGMHLLASCAPAKIDNRSGAVETHASPIEPTISFPVETVAVEPVETPIPVETSSGDQQMNMPAVIAVRQALSERTNVSIDEIELVLAEPVQWPDGCLGVAQPDEMCTQAIVDGYRIIMKAGGQEYEFHTNLDGRQVREVQAVGPKGQSGQPAVVRNAQKYLSDQLGIPLSQVSLQSIKPVDWPNSCLGVEKKGQVCAQVIVPGYQMIFLVDGKQFEIHTDSEGEEVILIEESASAPDEGFVSWEFTDAKGICKTLEIDNRKLNYGNCGKPLATVDLSEFRQKELAELILNYVPFEGTTKAGKLRFLGTGDNEATEIEQRSIAEWSNLVYAEAESGRSGAAWGVIIAWHREGGLAGFCDDLVIYQSGWAYASSCKLNANSEMKMTRLSTEQLAQFYGWVDQYRSVENTQKDPAEADAMEVRLNFMGNGTKEVSASVIQAMNDLAGSLYMDAIR